MNDSKHYWLRSGSYTVILNIQQVLFGFGSFYLLVRMLDKQEFGIWTLFIAITMLYETARSGLIQNALIKFLAGASEEERPKIISSSFFLNGLLMLVCIILNISLAGYFSRIWHYPGLIRMLLMFNVVYIFQGVLSQFQWIEQARLEFTGTLVTTIVRQGGFFTFVFLAYIFHRHLSLPDLIYAQGMTAAFGILIQYFFIREIFVFSWHLHAEWIKKLFHYGKYIFGTFMGSTLSSTINQMMLGTMISPAAAGSYNVALRIVSLSDIPVNALGVIVFPQSAKRFAEQGREAGKYLYEKSVGTIIALLLPFVLFVFIFPGFVVRIIAGSHYTDSIPLVQFVILTCLLNPFIRLFGTIMDSIGKPSLNFMMVLIFTVVNLGVCYFLIKKSGIMGCVYGTLTADIFICLLILVIMYKELKVNVLNTFIYAARFYPEFLRHYIKPLLSGSTP